MPDIEMQRLLAMYREDASGENRARWIANCERFFSSALRPAVLDELQQDACVVLHGSTTRNVDDPYSDLDCYLIVEQDSLRRIDSIADVHFIEFSLDSKPGHLNVTLDTEIDAAFALPDLETIYELAHAVPVLDPAGRFAPLGRRARLPMSDSVRRAALMHNYMEMRSWHRSVDNPLNRHDEFSALAGIIETINYALRCALVLDCRPFPYVKWLYVAAVGSPTGRTIVDHVNGILELLRTDRSALKGPERDNEVSSKLRQIRGILIDKARATGLDEPWLTRWWCFFDEQKVVFDGIQWSDTSSSRS
jgi:hypothetical protein